MGILSALGPGCATKRAHKPTWLMTETDAGRYIAAALEDPSPDARRNALEHLAKSRYARHDTVLKACRIVVRTDRSDCVRCAAIRLLSASGDPSAAEVLVELFQSQTGSAAVIPGQQARVDAVRGIYRLARDGALSQEQENAVVALAARLLHQDESRDVQIAAATLLGEFPHLAVVNALISSLNTPDFGVVYHAERSLMHLTGVTHDHNPHEWRAWLAAADDPFARRGALDDQLAPTEPKNWWQRTGSSVKRVFSGFRPRQDG